MIILDASVLIAHLESHDSHHTRATAILLDHCDEQFAASAVTLTEVLVGAVRTGRGDQARDALSDLEIRAIGLNPDAAWELAQLRVRTGLKLPDCCVLYSALSEPSAQLATFDARIAAAATAEAIGVVEAPTT